MTEFSFSEMRLIISNSSRKDKIIIPKKIFHHRINLIKTIKTYIKKYYNFAENKNNILYLSILYLDIIISKDKINLTNDKNLKYLCLCCFLLSLKFLGNFNCSKKIISNFCKNYKKENKIFEIQCLILLDYNLSYTTVFDYLNLIAIKEDKRFLCLCNYYLYQICEEKDYISYLPFYVSIAIFQLVKNNTNNIKRNHYDKYFKDERVKLLVKKINDIINPSIINDIICDDNNNFDFNNNYDNISNQNINIFNNNNIHNSIVIINTFSKNKIENNEEYNNSDIPFEEKNNSQRKIIKMLTNNFDRSNIEKDKINFSAKSSKLLSRSQRTNKLTEYNINYNLLSRISTKQNKKNSNYEISSYKKLNKNDSNNDFLYFLNSYKKNYKNNTTLIKRNLMNNYDKTQELFNNNLNSSSASSFEPQPELFKLLRSISSL